MWQSSLIIFSICLLLIVCFADKSKALELNAFGDVTFGSSDKTGETAGFSLGQLDLWASQDLDPQGKFKVFMELVIESPGSGFVVDLERLWVQSQITPTWSVRAGRMHTALGYWNRTFHHGTYMQNSIARPLFLDFEDGATAVLPTHIIGIMNTTSLDSSWLRTDFILQIGNGAYFNGEEIDPGNVGDIDDRKSLLARLQFSPLVLENLNLGLSALYGRPKEVILDSGGLPTEKFKPWVHQTIYVVDFSYVDPIGTGTEWFGGYFFVRNKDRANLGHDSSFWYLQAGQRVFDFITPYARYEWFKNIDAQDPYFMTLGTTEYSLALVGLRLDLDFSFNAATAVKMEVREKDEADILGGKSNSFWLQWTFSF